MPPPRKKGGISAEILAMITRGAHPEFERQVYDPKVGDLGRPDPLPSQPENGFWGGPTPLGREVADSTRSGGVGSGARTWARGVGREVANSFRRR